VFRGGFLDDSASDQSEIDTALSVMERNPNYFEPRVDMWCSPAVSLGLRSLPRYDPLPLCGEGFNVVGIVLVVIVTALVFDFTNGFHDTANAMATSIATGQMVIAWLVTLPAAAIMGAVAGQVAGTGTAGTVVVAAAWKLMFAELWDRS
jgi:hypothetical protein